jgi:glutathione synthase/RimK-type ligase-like ATP-grasp enzyme
VDLTSVRVKSVPAKVDTGADSSSIWASNIIENNGELSYTLFGPQSSFYTGEEIKTREYSLKSIKNSFGVTQLRYKVTLPIRIEGKLIRAQFSLADRSANRYPILIGRSTLHNKFLVDVSVRTDKQVTGKPAKILVLTDAAPSKIKSFYEKLSKTSAKKFTASVVRYKDVFGYIDETKLQLKLRETNQDLATFDLIYFKTLTKNREMGATIAAYARLHNIPYVDTAAELTAANSKFAQGALMRLRQVDTPQTIFMAIEYYLDHYEEIIERLGLPFIFKDNHGRKGRNNYLIYSRDEFTKILQSVNNDDQYIAQRYIPADGDYRILVFGKQAVLALYRKAAEEGSHLHNTSLGAAVERIELEKLPSEVFINAIRAAESMQWQVAGVDLIKDKKSGKWYCLEVNNSPQLVAGAFVPEKQAALAEFFQEQLGK